MLLHSSAMIAERLEQFRIQTLLPLDPIDKKTQAANDEIDQMIDSSLALGIVDLPTVNSRAGLYVYFHSLVSEL
jgi:mediator of RNA polymerase II transcription subunit 5